MNILLKYTIGLFFLYSLIIKIYDYFTNNLNAIFYLNLLKITGNQTISIFLFISILLINFISK